MSVTKAKITEPTHEARFFIGGPTYNISVDRMIDEVSIPIDTIVDYDFPEALDTECEITYGEAPGKTNSIESIEWEYEPTIDDVGPISGKLTVSDGLEFTPTLLNMDITATGSGTISFNPPLRTTTVGYLMNIVLMSGGAYVIGRLIVKGHDLV